MQTQESLRRPRHLSRLGGGAEGRETPGAGGPHGAQPLTEGVGRLPGSALSADKSLASEAGSPGLMEPGMDGAGTGLADCSSAQTDLFQKRVCSAPTAQPSTCSGSQRMDQLGKPELSHRDERGSVTHWWVTSGSHQGLWPGVPSSLRIGASTPTPSPREAVGIKPDNNKSEASIQTPESPGKCKL